MYPLILTALLLPDACRKAITIPIRATRSGEKSFACQNGFSAFMSVTGGASASTCLFVFGVLELRTELIIGLVDEVHPFPSSCFRSHSLAPVDGRLEGLFDWNERLQSFCRGGGAWGSCGWGRAKSPCGIGHFYLYARNLVVVFVIQLRLGR